MRTLLVPLVLAACGPAVGDTANAVAPDGPVADFLLDDLNPNSPRFGDAISPRDYLGEVSGWYFIHST